MAPSPLPARSLASAAALALALVPARPAGAAGGPDAFGYTWKASTDFGGPTYNYYTVPAAVGGESTELSIAGYSDGDGYADLLFPFEFTFYGITTDTWYLYTNGFLSPELDTSDTYFFFSNGTLGSLGFPVIAPWWDDLEYFANPAPKDWDYYGISTGTAPNRVVVVEWYQINHWDDVLDDPPLNNNETATFQVKFFEGTNVVEFHYQDVETGDTSWYRGISATVGIASGLPGEALQVSYNDDNLANSKAYAFYPPGDPDADGDGYTEGEGDCDDTASAVHPGAPDVCDGYTDNNCDGLADPLEADGDGDGIAECDGDCDDGDSSVRPGAAEVCDDEDQDCDGNVDEGIATTTWYNDVDGDGYGSNTGSVNDCADPGSTWITTGGDCDDGDSEVHPGAPLTCDDVLDNNCDGAVDPLESDSDGDGLSECEGDCDDTRDEVYPGAAELCDSVLDNDCDGVIDDLEADEDGDGLSVCEGDCDDLDAEVYPGHTEPCDGVDNNCNGTIDEGASATEWYQDADHDGHGDPDESIETCSPPPGYVEDGDDCDDHDADVFPGNAETCDGEDEDCDGTADDGLAEVTSYEDADGDGYGSNAAVVHDCRVPDGYALDDGDCDDARADTHPGAEEVCDDGRDNDCDGDADDEDSECASGDDDATPPDDDSAPSDDDSAPSDDDSAPSDDDASDDDGSDDDASDDDASDDDAAGDDDSWTSDDDDDDAAGGDDESTTGCSNNCSSAPASPPGPAAIVLLALAAACSLRRRAAV